MALLPILGGVVSPMVQSFNTCGGLSAFQHNPGNFAYNMADQIMQRYTGMHLNPKFGSGINTAYLFNTYGGLAMGIVGHKVASKFGVNSQLKKIPMIGKYIQL